MPVKKELVEGLKFGRWTIIRNLESGKGGNRRVEAECVCGKIKAVYLAHLKNGTSSSCGCFIKEKHTKHGDSKTKEHSAWWHMMDMLIRVLYH